MFPELISLWQFIALVFIITVPGAAVGFFAVFKVMQFMDLRPAKPKAKTKRKYTRRAKGDAKMQERAHEAMFPPAPTRIPRTAKHTPSAEDLTLESASGT